MGTGRRRRPRVGRWLRGLGRGLSVLLGLLVLMAAAALFLFSQTTYGRGLVASFIESSLQEALEGRVHVGPIVGGNLLTRAVVERVEIVGPDGGAFLSMEWVHLEYDPTRFLRSDFVFRRLEAEWLELTLRQYEEGDWNFDRIFPEEDPDAPPDDLSLVVHNGQLSSGRVRVRRPYGLELEGAAREEAIEEALRGETMWRVERTADGVEQLFEVDGLRGRFPLARIVHPRLPMHIQMEDVSGRTRAVAQPLEIRRFNGAVTFGDTIQVELSDLRLPASHLSGAGWVMPDDPPVYRFDLEARPFGFADLQWLPFPVPEEGGGPADLVFRSRAEVPVLEVREADARVRDSRMTGEFIVALEDPATFESLDVRLQPLRIGLVDRLLERRGEVDGYVTGQVAGGGPMDRLQLNADLRLQDLAGELPASGIRLTGGAGLVEPYVLRDLEIGLASFDIRWLEALEVDPGLEGRLDGVLTVDGRADRRLTFRTDLSHRGPAEITSRVAGQGSVQMEEPFAVDVRLAVSPLSLALLDPHFPNLELTGIVSGPLQARGTRSDLMARADLETERGELSFDGRFDLEAERIRYDAEVVAREVDLRQWSPRAPETRLAVRGRMVGEGTDPATLAGRFDLEVLPSEIAEARLDTSTVRFSVFEGLATVDTFDVRADVGEARGRGSFGLVEGVGGALVVAVTADDLSAWNRWVVEGWTADGPVEVPDDLFADFPVLPGERRPGPEVAEAVPDTLEGSLRGQGAVFGNLQRFSFGGRLEGQQIAYGAWGADALQATVDAIGPAAPDSFVVSARAREVSLPVHRLDSLALRIERTGSREADVRLTAGRTPDLEVGLTGAVQWAEERQSLALDEFRLRLGLQQLALTDSAFVAFGGPEGLVVSDLLLTGPSGERLAAAGVLARQGEVSFDLEVARLDVGELLLLLPDPPAFSGTLGAALRVRGTAASPVMEAEFAVDEPTIGTLPYSLLDGRLEYADREVTGLVSLHGEDRILARAEGLVRADLALHEMERRLPEDAFDFVVAAESFPLRFLEVAVEALEQIDGQAQGEVQVRGGPGAFRLQGAASVTGATAWVPELGVRFVDGEGRARFRGAEARIDSFVVASAAGGSALVAGGLELSDLQDPGFDLDIRVRRLRAVERRDMRFQLAGTGRLGGSYRRAELTGRFRVSAGELRQDEFLRRQQVVDLTDPDIYALIDTATVGERRLLEQFQDPFMQNLQATVILDVGPDLWLRSDEMNVEIAGEDLNVRVDRAEQALTMVGTVRLVRGTYRFTFGPYTQQLRIQEGAIEFVGVPGLNPNLRITAEYRTRTPQGPVIVRAIILGTLQQTELALESDPPLSESDQLCFLAVGSPCLAAVDQRFGERIARESALGILGAQITTALAADLGLDYLTLRTTGHGVDAGPDQVDGFFAGAFANTELEFGRYLGSDIFLTVVQPLGSSQLPGWSLTWRFTDDWTLEARAENRFARRFGHVVGSTLEMEQTYGLFLFREWTF